MRLFMPLLITNKHKQKKQQKTKKQKNKKTKKQKNKKTKNKKQTPLFLLYHPPRVPQCHFFHSAP